MTLLLRDGERLADGLRRAAREEIEGALTSLAARDGDRDVAVHSARKNLKTLRGLLRLARGEIGEEVFGAHNRVFRDAGRRLAPFRDRFVMVQTTDRLTEGAADLRTAAILAGLADQLRREAEAGSGSTADERERAAAGVVETLRGAQAWPAEWPIDRDGFMIVRRGLRRTYGSGRHGFIETREKPSAAGLHAWRKQVKYLWYQVRFLRSILPVTMQPLVESQDGLGKSLGEIQDLTVLRRRASRIPGLGSEELRIIRGSIGSRRKELQEAAHEIGERVYLERPRLFTEQIEGFWETRRLREGR